jgi:predicted RNA-binding Zn-ribbon protein involved in translation (DUF1610 family)
VVEVTVVWDKEEVSVSVQKKKDKLFEKNCPNCLEKLLIEFLVGDKEEVSVSVQKREKLLEKNCPNCFENLVLKFLVK